MERVNLVNLWKKKQFKSNLWRFFLWSEYAAGNPCNLDNMKDIQ